MLNYWRPAFYSYGFLGVGMNMHQQCTMTEQQSWFWNPVGSKFPSWALWVFLKARSVDCGFESTRTPAPCGSGCACYTWIYWRPPLNQDVNIVNSNKYIVWGKTEGWNPSSRIKHSTARWFWTRNPFWTYVWVKISLIPHFAVYHPTTTWLAIHPGGAVRA